MGRTKLKRNFLKKNLNVIILFLNRVGSYIENTLILNQFSRNTYCYPAILGKISMEVKISTPLQQINMNLLDQHIFPPSQSSPVNSKMLSFTCTK